MKKILSILLSLCFFCTGCFNHKLDKDVITFATWGSASEISILIPIIKDFEKENPNIKIKILHIPQDYFQKIHLLFASKTEPDVILINNQNIPVYKKFLLPLNKFIDKDIYFEKSIQSMSADNTLYAIPRDSSTLVIYYNKNIFDKAKIKYPDENWSLNDLKKTAIKLSHDNIYGIGYEPVIYYAQPYMHYFKGGIYKKDYYIGETEESIKGINFYKNSAYKYHYAPKPSEVGSKTLAQMFLEEKIAMHLSGRWMYPKYNECAKFRWGVVNFPMYKSSVDSTGWAISKNSKHKPSAIKFVLFLSSTDCINKFASSGLIVPARKEVAYSDAFNNKDDKYSSIFIKTLENSPVTEVGLNYNKDVELLNDKFFMKSGN